jgi:hypothetical protein
MGNCFSDPSKPSKSHGQKLGSGPPPPQQQQQQPNYNTNTSTSRVAQPPRTLGGGGLSPGLEETEGDARARALAAAEQRATSVSHFFPTAYRLPVSRVVEKGS